MLDLLAEVFLWLVADVLGGVFRSLRRREKHGGTFAERVAHARIRRRNRAIRRWLEREGQGHPLPDIGLRCAKCGYSLTGLTGSECPECGQDFDVGDMIDESVDVEAS